MVLAADAATLRLGTSILELQISYVIRLHCPRISLCTITHAHGVSEQFTGSTPLEAATLAVAASSAPHPVRLFCRAALKALQVGTHQCTRCVRAPATCIHTKPAEP
jgi:hypothetical protein